MRITSRRLETVHLSPTGQVLLALTSILIAIGTVFYRFVEDLSWLDSAYFTVITLATVGYGDFSPQTSAGKIFTIFYVLIGVGILVAFLTEVAGHIINTRLNKTAANSRD